MTTPRARALGDELVRIHAGLRTQLAELLAGAFPDGRGGLRSDAPAGRLAGVLPDGRGGLRSDSPADLREHCVLFCDAVEAHHDNEVRRGFPLLLSRFPELASALAVITREHETLAVLQVAVREAVRDRAPQEELRRLAVQLDAHFNHEEQLLVAVLNAL